MMFGVAGAVGAGLALWQFATQPKACVIPDEYRNLQFTLPKDDTVYRIDESTLHLLRDNGAIVLKGYPFGSHPIASPRPFDPVAYERFLTWWRSL
jgi:hypothetical protein